LVCCRCIDQTERVSSWQCWCSFFNYSANINLHSFSSFALHPSRRKVKHVFYDRRCGIADGPDPI
jgi:hypothetical protein